MESEAKEYVRNGNWLKALKLYNILLTNKDLIEEQILSYLQNRFECLYQLEKHEAVTRSCEEVLAKKWTTELCLIRIRFQLIRSLCASNQLAEAQALVENWASKLKDSVKYQRLQKLLRSFLILQPTRNVMSSWLSDTEKLIGEIESNKNTEDELLPCTYCNLHFNDKATLMAHCRTEEHEMMIMSDAGRDWFWRHPPRGLKADSYALCKSWEETGNCRYGSQCVEAHGAGELQEWVERLKYRAMKLTRAKDKQLYGKSYSEDLLEKWLQSTNTSTIMSDNITGVECSCSGPMATTVTSKHSQHEWRFTLKTQFDIHAIALLQDTHRNQFHLSKLVQNGTELCINNDQEFIAAVDHPGADLFTYEITVTFSTTIFGTFRQTVTFDFGHVPVLVKHLCVDVVPDSDVKQITEIRKELSLSIAERWTPENIQIVPFTSAAGAEKVGSTQWETNVKAMYPFPQNEHCILSNDIVSRKKVSKNNYRQYMHELLFVEEISTYDLMSRYNLTTKLQMTRSYFLAPNSMAVSTVKYSNNGELFASISLGRDLSVDTDEGRVILWHCDSVYLLPNPETSPQRKVYQAVIEDKGKNTIYLRLSSQTVNDLNLTADSYLEVQIQFQLNRIPFCERHYAVDKLKDVSVIFPDIYLPPSIPWSPSRQWSPALDSRLNLKQKEALVAITTPLDVQIPPILIIGPYGTGKTFTLAQTIKELIKDDSNKILLCTHSNSAADLYIKDYLHPWVEAGVKNARPFRIYYHKRWVTTVSPIVQKYCNIGINAVGSNEFQEPTIADIDAHKIIVVTLATSVALSALGLGRGTFTHILLDEAAQSLECEAVTPLTLADERTRIVLAGDHMQLGPEIHSKLAKECNFHLSLLERLYDHYPEQFPCKILLCENYRAHESIIQFTSDSFYDQKLVSSSKQPAHQRFYPLTFFTTLGEDVQDINSTAYYNISEVYEVVERVTELKRKWPSEWGDQDEQSIGVVTPYADQIFRIRSELRKRRIMDVSVEGVLNVQGKQFRVIILSTVRTRTTCAKSKVDNNGKYGFLSDMKLLNTAITRAQSLVAVVGDPVALCSVGRCSKIWERFIQICKENESFHGMTWQHLKLQLDGIELKKIYNLNPLAPEFIPRKYRERMNAPNFNGGSFPFVPNGSKIGQPLFPPIPPWNMIRPAFPQPIQPPHSPLQPSMRPAKIMPNMVAPYQFLNNVHFPKDDSLNADSGLLPPNMSLSEMSQQPVAVQEFWHNYLKNTFGASAANKFQMLLHRSKSAGVPLVKAIPHHPMQPQPAVQTMAQNNNFPVQKDFVLPLRDFRQSNPLYMRRSNRFANGNQKISSSQNGECHRSVDEHLVNMLANANICNPERGIQPFLH